MNDLFAPVQTPPMPANPHNKGTRVWLAYDELRLTACCRWVWHTTWAKAVDEQVRALGKRPEGESLAHCLSESRRAIVGSDWTVLRYKGHVCLCPEIDAGQMKAKLDERGESNGG